MRPQALRRLADALAKLPGIGPRSATRIAYYLVVDGRRHAEELLEALKAALTELSRCRECLGIAEEGQPVCRICSDPSRKKELICVVESPRDIPSIEETGSFSGTYHVLGGVLAGPERRAIGDLAIGHLIDRVRKREAAEVILALRPDPDGDATGRFVAEQLKKEKVKVTRLTRGVPTGTEIEYLDANTLAEAIRNRVAL